jgi:ABC-type phosphate/phosphonate transport system substrate-binding protein
MIDGNHLLFSREGTITPGATRVIAQTHLYDHCNMTVAGSAPEGLIEQFSSLLLGMDYGDAEVRPLLDLEGLKQWRPGRLDGYGPLEHAVDDLGFYDAKGAVTADDYQP